jgi:hypothetical protein
VRAGLGVEAEGAESAKILELRETFAIEFVKGILSRWCLNRDHDALLSLR